MKALEIFKKLNFVHIKNFLPQEDCNFLTDHIKNLAGKNKTIKDKQCPLSEALYGDVNLDLLLEKALPYIEKHVGKKLYPTYSYARLYKTGEELTNHRDRPSCEYSATITLGFNGSPWPIYMGTKEDKSDGKPILMNVGDIIIYKGTELFHWREKFIQGDWQTQVFLHYVDKDGQYSEYKFDKRKNLTHHKEQEDKEQLVRVYSDIFESNACDTIIKNYTSENIKREKPEIGMGENANVNKEIRNVERVIIPSYRDLGARLSAIGLDVNNSIYKFDITHCNQAEFLIYPQEGRYTAHIDTFIFPKNKECRKITVLAFLNDDFEGGKFFITLGDKKLYPPQSKGTVIAFPSFLTHGVEDIISGTRYSAVAWMCGPWFK